jgi:hypothetical protein
VLVVPPVLDPAVPPDPPPPSEDGVPPVPASVGAAPPVAVAPLPSSESLQEMERKHRPIVTEVVVRMRRTLRK